jgi:hypothetical protein
MNKKSGLKMTNSLVGKSILLISPRTFGYEKIIIDKMEELGANVIYYDDRPHVGLLSKVIIRVAPILYQFEIKKYFRAIIENTKCEDFDYIICIKQECFPKKMLNDLFANHQKAEKIFYTWDSFCNSLNGLNNLSLFDRCLTFDYGDAEKYNLIHRPLFYFDELAKVSKDKCVIKYDLSFVGSVHVHRYHFLKKIKEFSVTDRPVFIYQYVPSVTMFYIRKFVFFPYYGRSSKDEFKFVPLSKEQVSNIFVSSKAIVDFSHHNQRGLTMRTIEALGARKKLITNNVAVKKYDFYDPENILILDDGDYNIPQSFIDEPYNDIDKEVYARYSVEGWIEELLDI